MAVLPTQPRRGISPGGMPGPPMQGQGRGPSIGAAKAQSPIPASIPGINDVEGVPDPDRIVELFTAYTSGELPREQLILELNGLSEGQGGILGLLEGMEDSPEGQLGSAMPEAPPMNGPGLPSISPPGTIPPLEEPLDERHQRIAALIMQYGVTPEDANQMSTELNPMMGGREISQGQVDSAIDLWNTQNPHAPVSGNTLATIQNVAKSGGDYADFSGTPIGQIMGGIPGTNTGLFPSVSQGMSNMQLSSESPVFQPPAPQATPTQPATDPRQMMGGGPGRNPAASSVTQPAVADGSDLRNRDRLNVSGRETGQLVYDDQTGQMVDSGTWMPPKPKAGLDTAGLAEAQRPSVVPSSGGVLDLAQSGQESGQLVWDEQIGQMVDSATRMPSKARGGLDAAGLAEEQRRQAEAAQQAAWYANQGPDVPPERQRTYGPDVPPAPPTSTAVPTPTPTAIPPTKTLNMPESGPTQAGMGDWWNTVNPANLSWNQNWLAETGIPQWNQGWANPALQWAQNLFGINTGTAVPTPQANMPSSPQSWTQGFSGQQAERSAAAGSKQDAVGATAGEQPPAIAQNIPDKPLFGTDIFEDQAIGGGKAYTGETLIQPTVGEGGAPFPSQTEPSLTGFKTVDDFDVPELKTFLNALTEEARSGMMGQQLPGHIIDALEAISRQRMQGNTQLAQSNTQAAIAYLDRGAAVARDQARLALDQQRVDLEKGMSIADLTGKYGEVGGTKELTFAAQTEKYRRVMEQFALTGEVPMMDAKGEFVTDPDTKGVKSAGETSEQTLSYAELQQQKQISMTEAFGKLLNFDREGKLTATGLGQGQTMETLEAQSFGFTKMLQQQERAGTIMEPDPDNPGQFRQMTDAAGNVIDTQEMRRYAWDHDIASKQEEWRKLQVENDLKSQQLHAGTQQYGMQLSALIDAGKLAEAIDMRKQKNLHDQQLLVHQKNELRVNTLLTLAKPETMLFVQRFELLDDLGAALGIDFGQDGIPIPEPMVTPGQIPTMKDLMDASPTNRRIMLAEVAAFDFLEGGVSTPEAALSRITQWQPGTLRGSETGGLLGRTSLTGEAR